jgi:hypothetical protein
MGDLARYGKRLNLVKPVPYEQAYLIDELLTKRLTLLSGEPKAGKSLLATEWTRALLAGEDEFLGFKVRSQLTHVVWGVTDAGADEELRARLDGSGVEHLITVYDVKPASAHEPSNWSDLAKDLSAQAADLFVLDNVLGALGAELGIDDPKTATIMARSLRLITDARIPVLGVTHTPKGAGEGLTVASSPIGGRAFGAAARGICVLRRNKTEGLKLEFQSNRSRTTENEIPIAMEAHEGGSEAVRFARREKSSRAKPSQLGKPKQNRSQQALDAAHACAEKVIQTQPAEDSWRALADAYTPDWGVADTVRKKLQKLIEYTGERWDWRDAA